MSDTYQEKEKDQVRLCRNEYASPSSLSELSHRSNVKFLWVSHHKQLLGAQTEKELFLPPPPLLWFG